MRKIFLLVLFFVSILSYGQRKQYAEAVNLYNNNNFSESVLILEKLLNADYGKLNKEQELYSLMMRANAYYKLKDYSKAYENAQIYLTFLKNNKGLTSYSEEKKVINEVEKFIENTKALISVDDTNSVITSSNTSTVQNSENKSVEDNRSATLSVTGSEKTIEEEKANALTTQNSETKSVADDRNVTLTVTGSGKTAEEAKTNALRYALEQTYGVFISSKTEIFNDQVLSDQMSSVASGNIQSYEVLNETYLPNGTWSTTLKAVVSVSKLTSFAEAKGFAVELKGSLFALNIKQQILNEQAEIQAVTNMFGVLHELMQTAFDYTIKTGDPKSIDSESKNWEIPITVTAVANKNMAVCADYLIKTLSALSLSSSDVGAYETLNKQVYKFSVYYNSQKFDFFLRKSASIYKLTTLIENWSGYLRLFSIQSGLDEFFGLGEGTEFKFSDLYKEHTTGNLVFSKISFPSVGDLCASYSLSDKRNLDQINSMTGYKVKPRGVVSKINHGGIVLEGEDGHGLVINVFNYGLLDWEAAKKICDEIVINGFSDWRLPTIDELVLICKSDKSKLFGLHHKNEFSRTTFWSITEGGGYSHAYTFDFAPKCEKFSDPFNYENYFFAVRSF